MKQFFKIVLLFVFVIFFNGIVEHRNQKQQVLVNANHYLELIQNITSDKYVF